MQPRLRNILYLAFAAVWAVGLLGYFGLNLREFLGVNQPPDVLDRLRLSLMSTDASYHPKFYAPAEAELKALLAESLADDTPIYLVLRANALAGSTDDKAIQHMRNLMRQWVYPHAVAGTCIVSTADRVAAQCAPPSGQRLIIAFEMADIPGYDCAPPGERFTVCR